MRTVTLTVVVHLADDDDRVPLSVMDEVAAALRADDREMHKLELKPGRTRFTVTLADPPADGEQP